MSEQIHKKHNVSVLLYHLVCPTKYRKAVITSDVDEKLKEICAEISLRYEIEFLEIGTDSDHVHFLVQSVPMYSPTKILRTIKSITAKEIFRQMPEVQITLENPFRQMPEAPNLLENRFPHSERYSRIVFPTLGGNPKRRGDSSFLGVTNTKEETLSGEETPRFSK